MLPKEVWIDVRYRRGGEAGRERQWRADRKKIHNGLRRHMNSLVDVRTGNIRHHQNCSGQRRKVKLAICKRWCVLSGSVYSVVVCAQCCSVWVVLMRLGTRLEVKVCPFPVVVVVVALAFFLTFRRSRSWTDLQGFGSSRCFLGSRHHTGPQTPKGAGAGAY